MKKLLIGVLVCLSLVGCGKENISEEDSIEIEMTYEVQKNIGIEEKME